MYDMDRLDPDWELAEVHGKACSPGVVASQGEESRRMHGQEFCSCCLNIVHK